MYRNKLDKNGLGLLFIHADGCPACSAAKPVYSKIKEEYQNKVTFEDSQVDDELFEKLQEWLPSEHVLEDKVFPDGVTRKAVKTNEDGSLFLRTPLAFPSFLFFNNEGFIGHLVGADESQLKTMLDTLIQAQESNYDQVS